MLIQGRPTAVSHYDSAADTAGAPPPLGSSSEAIAAANMRFATSSVSDGSDNGTDRITGRVCAAGLYGVASMLWAGAGEVSPVGRRTYGTPSNGLTDTPGGYGNRHTQGRVTVSRGITGNENNS